MKKILIASVLFISIAFVGFNFIDVSIQEPEPVLGAVLSTDVVLWYDIDEGTGTTLDNKEGTAAFDGTISGAAWSTGGPTNLDDVLDFVRADNDSISLNNTLNELVGSANDFTFSIWLKKDDSTNDSQNIINDWGGSPNRSVLFRYMGGASNAMEFYISDNGTASELQLSYTDADITNYQHWTISRTGNNTEYCLNGSSVDTNTGAFTLPASATDILIGTRPGGGDSFDGKVAQFIVLSKAISCTEAADIYNGGDGITYDSFFGGAPAPTPAVPMIISWDNVPHLNQPTWTLAVIPDTQRLAANNASAYNALAQGVLTSNPSFFLQVGDIVNHGGIAGQWAVADTALSRLYAIPGLIGTGNHDYDDDAQGPTYIRDSDSFNALFNISDIQQKDWFFSSWPENKTDNTAGGLVINGQKYLFLNLEFFPRTGAVSWAKNIIASTTPDRIIMSTHMYIDQYGNHESDTALGDTADKYSVCNYSANADCHSGQELWENLVSQYPEFVLVVNGHDLTNGAAGFGYATRTDEVAGELVHQHFFNYQNMSGNNYADSAFYRTYTFNEVNDTVSVETYNPVTNTYLTDPENSFTFSLVATPTTTPPVVIPTYPPTSEIWYDNDGIGCTKLETLDGVLLASSIPCP